MHLCLPRPLPRYPPPPLPASPHSARPATPPPCAPWLRCIGNCLRRHTSAGSISPPPLPRGPPPSRLAVHLLAQTYEGGLGGEPGNEAHGGYTFCGVAALVLAGPGCLAQALDVPRLLHWLVRRQVRFGPRRCWEGYAPRSGAGGWGRLHVRVCVRVLVDVRVYMPVWVCCHDWLTMERHMPPKFKRLNGPRARWRAASAAAPTSWWTAATASGREASSRCWCRCRRRRCSHRR